MIKEKSQIRSVSVWVLCRTDAQRELEEQKNNNMLRKMPMTDKKKGQGAVVIGRKSLQTPLRSWHLLEEWGNEEGWVEETSQSSATESLGRVMAMITCPRCPYWAEIDQVSRPIPVTHSLGAARRKCSLGMNTIKPEDARGRGCQLILSKIFFLRGSLSGLPPGLP